MLNVTGQAIFNIYFLVVAVVGQSLIAWQIGRKGLLRLGLEGPKNCSVTFAMVLFVSMLIIGGIGGFDFPTSDSKHVALLLAWLFSIGFVSRQLLPISQRVFDRAKFLHESAVGKHGNYHERGLAASFGDIRGDGRLQDAERLYLRAIEMQEDQPHGELNIAIAHHQLGLLYRQEGRFDEASKRFEESLRILRSLEDLQPQRTDVQSAISMCLFRQAEIFHVCGKRDHARELYRHSLAIDERLRDADGVSINRRMLAEIDGQPVGR